ncbi:MAG TPA: PAS domain-containing sensor histidine kinase [Verrucomicrobiae bacterium]|nr:PAS domain-containing sensor histidine kinase [Verrucomicrobiae bacterium]
MKHPVTAGRNWDERPSAAKSSLTDNPSMFQLLFERSADAMLLFDPQMGVFVDCNQAAVDLMRASTKEQLLQAGPEDFSPPLQPDGVSSREKTLQIIALVEKYGNHRFEWVGRRFDGNEVPMEVLVTSIQVGGRSLNVSVVRDITERKKTERELLELNQSLERRVAERTAALTTSEAQFRALVEHAPEAIVVFDGDTGRFLFGNEHACTLYGVPMEKLAELTPADVSPELQADGRRSDELARKLMDEALAGGTPVFEWIHRQPDGKLIPTEVRLLRLPAEGKNLVRASIIDNTERKRAQTALAESETRFSAAFQESPILIAIGRMSDGKFVLVNDAFAAWTGYTRDEIIGRNTTELGVWEQPQDREAFWADLRRTGSIRERECSFRNRHGQQFTMLVSSKVIQINHVPHVLAMGLDITGRKKAEAELMASEARLRESEARFSVAFQASPVFISMLRMSDERYVLANDALLNWLGYAREEVLGRTSAELGMWDYPAEREAVWRDMRTNGSIRQRECRWRNRCGESSTVLLSGETITIDHEPHMLSLVLDISQRKNAEGEILKALAREKELSQLKSNFVSMVSHEFRTPLGIIQSSAELLRDFYQKMPPAERDEQLESITRNTRRMAGMMEEILVLSRLDAGKLDFQPATLDLNVFCRRLVDEVLSATNRRCRIELSLASVPAEAKADERLLGHIFTNLLSNAVKYSEPGATVSFAVQRDGVDAVCIVRDQGIGIPGEDHQHLFKAFHRGSNVETRPGTGLGLLVVKRCVELHRGSVRLVSKLGEGTTVTVRLPVLE